jgi:acetoacetyl-CoA synthetase
MADLRAATPEMFESIYPLLAGLNPALSKEQWRLLVDYPWRVDGDGLGYVLIDQDAIVGFLSTLYSWRVIDGKRVRFCNTAHWVVKEQFRADSMRLLLAAMRDRNCTLTNLTSTTTVSSLMQKLGFQVLERSVKILIPAPVLPAWPGGNGVGITTDARTIGELLNESDRTIFEDHADSKCGHHVVCDGDEYCYIVFARKTRRVLGVSVPYCHIHYISDRAVFLRHLARIKWHFLRNVGAWFMAVDERQVGKDVGVLSRSYPLGAPRYYRSQTVGADQIDNLYTELVLGV